MFPNTLWFQWATRTWKEAMHSKTIGSPPAHACWTTSTKVGWSYQANITRNCLWLGGAIGDEGRIKRGWWSDLTLGRWMTFAFGWSSNYSRLHKHLSNLARIYSCPFLLFDHVNCSPSIPKSINPQASIIFWNSPICWRSGCRPPFFSKDVRIWLKSPVRSHGRSRLQPKRDKYCQRSCL